MCRPAYLAGLVLAPLICLLLGALAWNTKYGRPHQAATDLSQIALIDHSGLPSGPGPQVFRRYDSLPAAILELTAGHVTVLFELPADYTATGRVVCYRREPSLLTRNPSWLADALAEHLRARLAATVDPAVRTRLLRPVQLQEMTVGAAGAGQPVLRPPDPDRTGRLIAGAVLAFGLIALLTVSSSYFLQSVVTERENHVIDVILVSVSPYELMLGKLIGLSAACLGPALLFVGGFGGVAALQLLVGPGQLALAAVFLLLGYLFMGSLMVATGMLVDVSRESNLVAAFWTVWAVAPVVGFLKAGPALLDVLTYFPLTSPITALLRISLGTITPLQASLAAALLGLSTWACLQLAAALIDRVNHRAGPGRG